VFDVGFWELLIIALLALLVLGPEKLPGIVKTAGNWAGRAKFMARSLRMQVEQEMAREIVAKREAEAAAVTAQRKKEREEKAAETKVAEPDAASASTEPGNDRDAPA
jgi:sec-independent protein translocase protein TatB